jgi:hypothetical protein
MKQNKDSINNDGEQWIVVNIGCIECGVSTNIVGVFDNKETADKVAKDCDETYSWREGGQNEFEVFPMPPINKIHDDYSLLNSDPNAKECDARNDDSNSVDDNQKIKN